MTITSKQRAKLRAIAGTLEPVCQLGKEGITPAFLAGAREAILKRELIKITVLKNCGLTAKEAVTTVAERLGAIPVCAIGSVIVVYRQADDKKNRHIEL